MPEILRNVTTRRQFRDAIVEHFGPMYAGFMLGSNGTLEETRKHLDAKITDEIKKAGGPPSEKRPFILHVNVEKSVEEFLAQMHTFIFSNVKKRKEDSAYRREHIDLLLDMFRAHPWKLTHFDQIRRAGSTGEERFAIARQVHELGITPAHLELAFTQNIDLTDFLEKVKAGRTPEDALQEIQGTINHVTIKVKRPKSPKPPFVVESVPAGPRALEITDSALLDWMKEKGVKTKTRQRISAENVKKYEAAGLRVNTIPLGYAVHSIQARRKDTPMPMKDLKSWINSNLTNPNHVIFGHHVQQETGEKPEVVLHAFEVHAKEKDLKPREVQIILKANELTTKHDEGMWPDLLKHLKQK